MREKLREARLKKGLTQKAVAKLAGIDRTYYVHLERGDSRPSLPVALRVAKVLEGAVEDFFGDVTNNQESA